MTLASRFGRSVGREKEKRRHCAPPFYPFAVTAFGEVVPQPDSGRNPEVGSFGAENANCV